MSNLSVMRELGFARGVNLGGWLSQCDYSQERLDRFITERDLDVIASWGLDHVRVPVDYNVLEAGPGYSEEGFQRLERAAGWCRVRGLHMVLDPHKTAGFSFDAGEVEAGFFDSPALQERFYRLWEEIARRFGSRSGDIAFELLNEVTDQAFCAAWNRISGECIRRIRALAPDTLILVGGYHNNSAAAVPDLAAPPDSRVIYNFHCYDPLPFTHQGAPWVPQLDQSARPSFASMALPEDYFDRRFAPAIEAALARGTGLYCGEYGVIDRADPADTLAWFRLIHATFERNGIARCAWSYKRMDFGLSDPRLDGVRGELVRLL